MTLKMAKAAVRLEIKNRLAKLSDASKSLQSSIVFALNEYKSAQRVGIYLSMPNEVTTDDIVKDLLYKNIKCYIPWYKSSDMIMVKLESIEDFTNMPSNKWGIRQPISINGREDAITGGLDLMLVPGLAFSLEGDRLGRGKGYYDKYLTKMSNQMKSIGKTMYTVGLAFKEQITNVPTESTDYKLDKVLYS